LYFAESENLRTNERGTLNIKALIIVDRIRKVGAIVVFFMAK